MLPLQNFEKITIFFTTANMLLPNSGNFPKFSWNGFCNTTNVMPKNEVKANKDGRYLLQLATSFKEIVSNNTK